MNNGLKKKIYIAYTGGTIGMRQTSRGYAPANNLLNALLEKLPQTDLETLPSFDLFEYPELIDSSNIQPAHWQTIAADIASRYDQYDGFVVLHGTDTMAYTSSMLSFMLQNLGKPVVLTGSQIPLCEPKTDAIENVIGALTVAANPAFKEVCLYFAGRILRGNRSRKVHTSDLPAFDSPNYPWLGTMNNELTINNDALWQPEGAPTFTLTGEQKMQVAPIVLFPGITADWLSSALNQPLSAFILKTYGAGNAPDQDEKLLKVLHDATSEGKLIINLTKCYQGPVRQGTYEAGSALAKAGLISAYDSTPEAMFCKLHFLFSQGLNANQVRQAVVTNICGEVTIP